MSSLQLDLKKSGHPTKYLLGRKLDPIEKWGNILRWKYSLKTIFCQLEVEKLFLVENSLLE